MTVVVLTDTGLSSWTVPGDCPDTLDLAETWGGGASGAGSGLDDTSPGGFAGGGGAYSASANVDISGHGGSVPIDIGDGGAAVPEGTQDGNDGGDTSFNSGQVLAKGGDGGLDAGTVGAGGLAAEGVGDTKFNGGDGGSRGGSGSRMGGGGGGGGTNSPDASERDGAAVVVVVRSMSRPLAVATAVPAPTARSGLRIRQSVAQPQPSHHGVPFWALDKDTRYAH